ncbi:MAG: DEAD/DEAH box helicase [Desulfurococcales archaeon]|nr:DEAD/DEAH box helicase [Desulfurococcales archaeon]
MEAEKVNVGIVLKELNLMLKQTGSRIAYIHKEESGDPPPGPTLEESGLHPALVKALKEYGIQRLYDFQYRVFEEYKQGKDLVIVAGTGTGKTEAFIIPVVDEILKSKESAPRPYAIVMYPTKALARDQLYRFKLVLEGKLGLKVEVLDGDTPRDKRAQIYTSPPHVLVTNPDMMHYGLALSDRIRRLVSGFRVLVLDEMHVYQGVFGSHVKWVIERLKRYSDSPQIIGAGATIGNPQELGRALFGRDPSVVFGPKRRKGRAYHVLVAQGGISRWTLTAQIVAFLSKKGLKTLCFVDSQQMSELVARIARKSYGAQVAVHRAGLEASYRRRVEQDFREGRLKAVVATPTMELGIDLGDLDAIVMATLPRSISSYLQRAGRAGRRGRPGLIVTVLGDDPIESYFLRRPKELFSMEPDPSYIEPANPEIVRVHAAALLLESGILKESNIPEPLVRGVKDLEILGAVKRYGDKYFPVWDRLREIVKSSGLRSAGPQVTIVEGEKRIGYRELPLALYDLYPGAIYYHAGKAYLSVELDLEKYRALVRRVGGQVKFYTKPMYTVDLSSVRPLEKRMSGPLLLTYAEVDLNVIVTGYVVREEYTGRKLGEVIYDKPITWKYTTKAVITRYPNPGIADPIARISGYHALEHALISASKPVVGASDTDLGGISYPSGHIVIYDSTPGGNGASRLVFERYERVQDIAENILADCDCEDGCPKCVYSPYCGNNNQFLSRRNAYKILISVLKAREGIIIKEKPFEGKPLA